MKLSTIGAIIAVFILLACVVTASEPPAPVYVSNKMIGGSALNEFTPGVANGKGLNNIGLLVRTSGKVTFIDTTNQFFYIDDGSSCVDGTRRPDNSVVKGIRVSYGGLASGVPAITPYAVDSRVVVTGIVSTCVVPPPPQIGGLVRPNIRLRKQDDLVLSPLP